MEIFLPLFWTFIFLLIIWKHPFFKIPDVAKWIIPAIFACKIAASVVIHIIYTRYYPDHSTADIFKYFDDATALYNSIHYSVSDFLKILFGIQIDSPDIQQYIKQTNFWSQMYVYTPFIDSRLIIRINMIIMLFSGGNIAVHYLFADFISLIAYLLIFKTFALYFNKKYILLLFIFLIPSSIIWNASMIKECPLMLGVGLFVFSSINLTKRFSFKMVITCLLGFIILFVVKIYVLIALIPAIIAFILNEKLHFNRKDLQYIIIILSGIIILGILDFGLHKISFFESLANKRNDFINTAIITNAGSFIYQSKFISTPCNFLTATPIAIWNAIALPYIWQTEGILQIIPSIESLLFFILLVLVIFFFKRPEGTQKNFIWFCITFSIILLWIVGITTPVTGAIVRYKIPIFPFLYTIFALLVDWDKIFYKLKHTNNYGHTNV